MVCAACPRAREPDGGSRGLVSRVDCYARSRGGGRFLRFRVSSRWLAYIAVESLAPFICDQSQRRIERQRCLVSANSRARLRTPARRTQAGTACWTPDLSLPQLQHVGARRDSPKPRGGAKRAISHVADSYQGLWTRRVSWLPEQFLSIFRA